MALTTFDELKSYMELKKASFTDYPTLGILNDSMQSVFEGYCTRLFDSTTHIETFIISDTEGQSSFWIKGTPMTAVSSVTLDGDALVITDDYIFDNESLELVATAEKGSVLVITYAGGLVDQTSDATIESTTPGNLKLAAIRQIAFEFENRANTAASKIDLDGNSKTFPEFNLLPYTIRILDNYKNYGPGF